MSDTKIIAEINFDPLILELRSISNQILISDYATARDATKITDAQSQLYDLIRSLELGQISITT